jgi:hypothetical protein
MIRLRVDFGGRLSSRGWDLVPLQGRPLSCALQVSVPIFYEAQAKSKIRKERTATAAASKRQQPQTSRNRPVDDGQSVPAFAGAAAA